MITRVAGPLLLILAVSCRRMITLHREGGAVSEWDDWHANHRLDLKPHGVSKNPLMDDGMPSHFLDLPTPQKQIYHNHLDPIYVGTYPSRLYSFDDVEFNKRCLPCPKDVKIVAKRRSLTASFLPPSIMSPTCPEVSRENAVVHINRGPIPGEQLGPGLYPIYLTIINYNEPIPRRAVQCRYTYEVIVNKCSPLYPGDGRVKVICSHENAWGSNCTFSCPSGYKREGFARTRCNNDLSWSHDVPKCRLKKKGACKLTAFQGVFECNNGEDLESIEYVSSGTVCRLSCAEGSHIPRRQRHLAYIRCSRGHWNTTTDPICAPSPFPRSTPNTHRVNKPRYVYIKSKNKRNKAQSKRRI